MCFIYEQGRMESQGRLVLGAWCLVLGTGTCGFTSWQELFGPTSSSSFNSLYSGHLDATAFFLSRTRQPFFTHADSAGITLDSWNLAESHSWAGDARAA